MIDESIKLIVVVAMLVWISPYVARVLRMPTSSTEIILGSLVAFFGLIEPNPYYDLLAQVGFLYLLFLAGLEANVKQIVGSSKEVIRGAFAFLGLMIGFSLFFGLLFGLHPVVIISLPLISLGLLAPLSKEFKGSRWISLAFVVGIIGEIVSIAALTVFQAATTTGFGLALVIKIGSLVLFIVAIYALYKLFGLLFWWFPEIKRVLVPKYDQSSQDVRLSMALFFIFIAVMLVLNLKLALGAFIAGVAISAFFHHEKELEEKMSSLGFGFLVPLFFIHVGTSFDLTSLRSPGIVSGALLITFLMILVRVLAAVTLKKIYGSKEALLTGLALSMPLTLLVAVATIGYNAGYIDKLTYYQLILASIFEVLLVMPLIKYLALSPKRTN